MSLSSRQAAPVVVLHGGPSVPSNYLYPLVDVVPYRSIVFHDQLGCGSSDEPPDVSLYSMRDSVEDMKALLKKLGVRRFHLYGQSYGGILAFEYLKSVATEGDDDGSAPVCLSAILSSAPTNVTEVESEFVRLIQEISSSAEDSKTEAELAGVVSENSPVVPAAGNAACPRGRVRTRRIGMEGHVRDIRLRGLAPPGGRGEDASGNDNEGRARLRERVVRRRGS
jgi:pimeloyl-ACP methyl ester carboxylesterase